MLFESNAYMSECIFLDAYKLIVRAIDLCLLLFFLLCLEVTSYQRSVTTTYIKSV